MHLAGFLKSRGFDVAQRDLSIKVVRDVLLEYGDETTGELLEFLGGPAPVEAKRGASEAIEDLALSIRDQIDPDFGFSRYAEHLCRAVADFGELERLIRRRGVIDKPLERRLKAAMEEVKPSVVGVTCPFPGTLVAAFKIARFIKRRYPGVRLLLGGGYVSTELREMTDRRPYRYFDDFQLDEGYAPFARLLGDRGASAADVPPFVKPDYEGIDWGEYFDVAETDNFVTNLWNCGKWVKLVMARGCYWRKCAFCDVKLPYIGCFKMPKAAEIVDAMEEFFGSGAAPLLSGVHFVDEAMPPALVSSMCDEILRRKLEVAWWGNIRFDNAFTTALAKKMARAGCIAVTGGRRARVRERQASQADEQGHHVRVGRKGPQGVQGGEDIRPRLPHVRLPDGDERGAEGRRTVRQVAREEGACPVVLLAPLRAHRPLADCPRAGEIWYNREAAEIEFRKERARVCPQE